MTYFDPSLIAWYYINLEHRADRREHIAKQLDKAGIQATRFPALTKDDWCGPDENVAVMMKTPKTIGNWLSHTGVWIEALTQGKHAGVLEDDAMLCEDFQERLTYIETHMDRSWDILYLGATYHVDPPVWHKDDIGRDFELTGIKHIHRVYGAFSNQGYIVHRDSIERVLHMMNEVRPRATGSDHAMIMLQPRLQCYSFTPGMVFQIDGQSDIGDGFTKFSGFYDSLGPHIYANRLEDFDYDSYGWGPGRL